MVKVQIFVEDSFCSAHYLPNVPDGHKCKKMHGHTYHVRIIVGGAVDEHTGMIVDYETVRLAWQRLKNAIDHTLLNQIPGLDNPTCEMIAPWILAALSPGVMPGRIESVEVRETASCGAIATFLPHAITMP